MAAVAVASVALLSSAALVFASVVRVLAHLRWRDERGAMKLSDGEREATAKAIEELRSRCMKLEQARGMR